MSVLILGGLGFLGRHIAETLTAAGRRVCTLSRGEVREGLPAEVEHLRADRDDAPAIRAALSGREWDVCIDTSGYTPRQVRATAECLQGRVQRYVYVSAVSVYGDPVRGPVTEEEPLLPPAAEDVVDVNGETYGPLKVACENIVRAIHGERSTVLRPQVVVGPRDPTVRYTFWLHRAAQQAPMLAPGDGTDHLQVIDVRDVARFVLRVVERDISGTFNLAGPRLTWAAFLETIGARNPVWVDAALLKAANLSFIELPLYRPHGAPRSSLMHVSSERALAAGLVLTAPSITAADTRRSMGAPDLSGTLTPEAEARLIAQAAQR
jgi:2'-hydroxyisoflavone reductase